jgi:hypothetical protein
VQAERHVSNNANIEMDIAACAKYAHRIEAPLCGWKNRAIYGSQREHGAPVGQQCCLQRGRVEAVRFCCTARRRRNLRQRLK